MYISSISADEGGRSDERLTSSDCGKEVSVCVCMRVCMHAWVLAGVFKCVKADPTHMCSLSDGF